MEQIATQLRVTPGVARELGNLSPEIKNVITQLHSENTTLALIITAGAMLLTGVFIGMAIKPSKVVERTIHIHHDTQ